VKLIMIEFGKYLVLEVVQQIRREQPPACPASTKPSSWWISTGRCSLSLATTASSRCRAPGIHHGSNLPLTLVSPAKARHGRLRKLRSAASHRGR
jgi:hypothetical protein